MTVGVRCTVEDEYLSQAISGRNIDWLRSQHMHRLSLTFRKADMETKVRRCCLLLVKRREIAATAGETRDSIGRFKTISARFTLEVCVTAENRQNPNFWGSRSFRVIDVGTPGKLVSSACYDAQQVCALDRPRRVYSGKITIS